LSDAPSCSSGFGRITRELALRIHADLPEFRVACAGYGGYGSRSIPFPEYHYSMSQSWIPDQLPEIAEDFAPGERLTILSIWDCSRLPWLSKPEICPNVAVRKWLLDNQPKRWIYTPMDAESPYSMYREILSGFDRVLNYTAFGARVTGFPDHIPHGIDTTVFHPMDRKMARGELLRWFRGLKVDSLLVGIVATNQGRKDWRLGIETLRLLLDRGHDVRAWAHTDGPVGWWDIPRLVKDYGLEGRVATTSFQLSDPQMAWMYSACNVSLGIGLGEGMGYASFESVACGTPHIAPNYGGGAEFMEDVQSFCLVGPSAYYYEGPGCAKRPVMEAKFYADAVEQFVFHRDGEASLPSGLKWENVWPEWKNWLLEVRP
jgi:glycosyltransferase involved in cell wall biosynthesis